MKLVCTYVRQIFKVSFHPITLSFPDFRYLVQDKLLQSGMNLHCYVHLNLTSVIFSFHLVIHRIRRRNLQSVWIVYVIFRANTESRQNYSDSSNGSKLGEYTSLIRMTVRKLQNNAWIISASYNIAITWSCKIGQVSCLRKQDLAESSEWHFRKFLTQFRIIS